MICSVYSYKQHWNVKEVTSQISDKKRWVALGRTVTVEPICEYLSIYLRAFILNALFRRFLKFQKSRDSLMMKWIILHWMKTQV
jgi:hypothetical protein